MAEARGSFASVSPLREIDMNSAQRIGFHPHCHDDRVRISANAVRINPVGRSRVAASPRRYGDCKAKRAGRGATFDRGARAFGSVAVEHGTRRVAGMESRVTDARATTQRFRSDARAPQAVVGERAAGGLMTCRAVEFGVRRGR